MYCPNPQKQDFNIYSALEGMPYAALHACVCANAAHIERCRSNLSCKDAQVWEKFSVHTAQEPLIDCPQRAANRVTKFAVGLFTGFLNELGLQG